MRIDYLAPPADQQAGRTTQDPDALRADYAAGREAGRRFIEDVGREYR